MEHIPLVIVGAGLAGLTVAEGLVSAGHYRAADIVVLERYPAIGGRVVTNREPYQYEIGAGRIHASHRRVHALIRRFRLHTYPIAAALAWRGVDGSAVEGPESEGGFKDIRGTLVRALERLSPAVLATHTVAELVCPTWRPLLARFPYWAETHMLRADLALEAFRPDGEMGTYEGYVGVVEGLDAITAHLGKRVAALGVDVRTRHRVADVKRRGSRGSHGGFDIVGDFGKKAEARPFHIRADKVIIATCRCSLGTFSVLKGRPLLRQLQTSPLMRIYAAYPPDRDTGKVWFHDLPKTVTDSPLRFVIPIDPRKGLIMISYTDGPEDTGFWRNLEGAALEKALAREVKRVFGIKVPPATYLKKHDWPSGCTYWTPGRYDVSEAIAAAMFPREGVFVVGESVAKNQAWMESALESAETLLAHWDSAT